VIAGHHQHRTEVPFELPRRDLPPVLRPLSWRLFADEVLETCSPSASATAPSPPSRSTASDSDRGRSLCRSAARSSGSLEVLFVASARARSPLDALQPRASIGGTRGRDCRRDRVIGTLSGSSPPSPSIASGPAPSPAVVPGLTTYGRRLVADVRASLLIAMRLYEFTHWFRHRGDSRGHDESRR